MQINLEKLESLLVKNWTEFISYKTLFPTIKEHVLGLLNSMPKMEGKASNIITNRASMSKFTLKKEFCVIWFEYQISLEVTKYVSGTIEFKIMPDGTMIFSDLEGCIYTKQH
jgi:hypothetical protein